MGKVIFHLKFFHSKLSRYLLNLLAISVFFVLFVPSLTSANDTPSTVVKIGVLAKRGHNLAAKKWGPTADYLSKKVTGRHFKIVPLDFENVRLAVMSQNIDFLITNSSYYVILESDHGLSRIATLKNLHGNKILHRFGGVIFTRSDSADINTLNDLIGKSFWAVNRDSLGGWMAAWREFYAHSIQPDQDFGLLKFAGTHDAVVQAVLNGEADAGTVRTDTLERMAAEGKIVLADFKILNSQTKSSEFDYLLSTRLYPEWPFATLSHVSPKLVKDVATALLSMPESSPAAKTANIGGWDAPLDYQSIHELLREQHLCLYQKYIGKITLTDFLRKYWQGATLLIFLCFLLVFIATYKSFLNKRLEQRVSEKTSDLRKEILERKQAEEEREHLLQAIAQSNETIVITNLEGTIQYTNPAFEKVTGYTCEEAIGMNPHILKSGKHDDVFYQELWETLTRDEIWRGRFLNKKKDGTLYTEDATISPVFDASGKKVNYIAIKRDITHEIEMETQLRQKYKMEAVGVMAGGMAHNFNNNLSIILGSIELSKMKMQPNPKVDNYLNNAKIAALRSSDLVKQILTYSRQGAKSKTPIQLTLIIDETLKLLHSTIPTTINLQQRISSDSYALMINADSSQIQECLINLCNNATYAMDEEGPLTIALDRVELQKHDIPVQYESQPGHYAKLSVQDTGSGMSAETVDKIFDLFFTTKPVDQGTGVGLSTVQGIVTQHGGLIKVNSQLGKGTTFELYFPMTEQTQTAETPSANEDIPGGTEHILYVDDDPLLANLGEQMLTIKGYAVTTMTDSTKALKLFTDKPNHFDLIITDQTMPDLTGKQLIQEVQKIRPNIPTILCTGYSSKIDEEKAVKLGASAFLMKPLDMPQLLQTVRRILDTGKESVR